MQEIQELNDLMDKIEAKFPFKMPRLEEEIDPEFERLVSFQTRVEHVTEFFENKA